jgi:RimJ/RimL family protein N-acetyltransferase
VSAAIRMINVDQDVLALLENLPRFEQYYDVSIGTHGPLLQEIGWQTRRLLCYRADDARWGGYLAVEPGAACVVGWCAFKDTPSADGTVEIAYYSFDGFEGRGFATAMAESLIAIAQSDPAIRRIVAHTLPELGASARVLDKVGMTFEGVVDDPLEGRRWRWSLEAASQRRLPISQRVVQK